MAEVYVTHKKDLGFGVVYRLSDGSKVSEKNLPPGISFGPPKPAQPQQQPLPPPPPPASTVADVNPEQVGPISNEVRQDVARRAQDRVVETRPLDELQTPSTNTTPEPQTATSDIGRDGNPSYQKANATSGKSQTDDDASSVRDDTNTSSSSPQDSGYEGNNPDGSLVIGINNPPNTDRKNTNAPPVTEPHIVMMEKNKLDPYVNYTYNIDLYALDFDAYNTLIKDENSVDNINKHLLISSGGKRKGRNPEFDDDFYIDDFEMDTVGPTTQRTRGTNQIGIKFKITEPYGVSLIERLIQVAQDLINVPANQYTQVPYMLRISFVGYDENGQPHSIPKTTKHLIIQMYKMTFEVNEGGATYAVDAVPYSHSGLDANIDKAPSNFEISAKNIGDFFSGSGVSEVKVGGWKTERYENAHGVETTRRYRDTTTTRKTNTSLIALLNQHERLMSSSTRSADIKNPNGQQVKPIKIYPDVYDVVLDPEIASALLEYRNFEPTNASTAKDKSDPKNFYQNFVQNVQKKFTITRESGTSIRIKAGTSLVEIVGMLLLHSTYIHDQFLTDPNVPNETQLKWFKVTPMVEVQKDKWDEKTGRFAQKITYFVSKHNVSNIKIESRKKSIPRGKVEGDGYHKLYNYMYTGENTDILNFDIKYNIAYQTAATTTDTTSSDAPETQARTDVENNAIRTAHLNRGSTTSGGVNNTGQGADANIAIDLMNNVLTNGVDLWQLNLEIIGDPDYIMQNDVFSTKHLFNAHLNSAFLDNGSINYDYGELYAKLIFNTPVDYNPETGIMDLNNKSKHNSSVHFGGIYQVWKVKHSLSGGQFTQTLHGNRVMDTDKKVKSNTERTSFLNDVKSAASKRNFGSLISAGVNKFNASVQQQQLTEDVNINASKRGFHSLESSGVQRFNERQEAERQRIRRLTDTEGSF